jgi:hypothetical protein
VQRSGPAGRQGLAPNMSDSPHNNNPPTLSLAPLNANVYTVHLPSGAHVGNLKRIGSVWKLKAIGYDDVGDVLPGGGPLTDYHNTVLQVPDAGALNRACPLRM